PVYLSDLPLAAGSTQGDVPETIGGTTYHHVVYGYWSCDLGLDFERDLRPRTQVYDLNGDYNRLQALIGLDDPTPFAVIVRFEVDTDGQVAVDKTLGADRSAPVDIDVTG